MKKLLFNTVALVFFVMVNISVASATVVNYLPGYSSCTLIPNATITSDSDVGRSTIYNSSKDIVIEPNSCMQVILPNSDAVTATVVFGGLNDYRKFGSSFPINIYVTVNQQNPTGLAMVINDRDDPFQPFLWHTDTWGNNDVAHDSVKNIVFQANNDFVIYDNGGDIIWNSGITSDWLGSAVLSLQITTYHPNDYKVELYINRHLPLFNNSRWTKIIHCQTYGNHYQYDD